MSLRSTIAIFVVVLPASVVSASAQPAPQTLACEGAFAKDSTHERVVQAFGKQNVVFQTVPGPEGTKLKATVVYPKDPKRRLEITWWDEKGRKRPSNIAARDPSTWATSNGIKVGSTLAAVEALNGKPFKLSGFDWDYGGRVTNWQGGKLAGPCHLTLMFGQAENAPEANAQKVLGDQEFLSNDPNMRAVKPTVFEVAIGYPK